MMRLRPVVTMPPACSARKAIEALTWQQAQLVLVPCRRVAEHAAVQERAVHVADHRAVRRVCFVLVSPSPFCTFVMYSCSVASHSQRFSLME